MTIQSIVTWSVHLGHLFCSSSVWTFRATILKANSRHTTAMTPNTHPFLKTKLKSHLAMNFTSRGCVRTRAQVWAQISGSPTLQKHACTWTGDDKLPLGVIAWCPVLDRVSPRVYSDLTSRVHRIGSGMDPHDPDQGKVFTERAGERMELVANKNDAKLHNMNRIHIIGISQWHNVKTCYYQLKGVNIYV